MTEHQQAFKEAEKELAQERKDKIKDLMKMLLQKIQDKKDIKAQAEDDLRLLKLDLDDLQAGKIDKIKERHDKSQRVREVSPVSQHFIHETVHHYHSWPWPNYQVISLGGMTAYTAGTAAVNTLTVSANEAWADATSGTYIVNCSNGTTKEMLIG